MRSLITLLLILIAISSFCQESYPQKLVLDRDTVVCLSQDQIRTVNGVFDERDFYRSKLDSLKINFELQGVILDRQYFINQELVKKNTQLLVSLDDWKNKDNTNKQLQAYYKTEIKQQKSKGIKLAIGGYTIGITTGIILILILNK